MDLEKISEAEAAITGGDLGRPRSIDEIVSHFGEQACFVLLIFARICLQTERSEKASEAYRKALKLNPFLWHAFEELCNRGEKPDPVRTFHVSNFDNFSMCHGVNPVVNFANSYSTFSNDSVQLQMAFLSPAVVPSATLTEANDQKSIAKRQLISRKETPLQQSKPVFSQSGNTGNNSNIVSTPSPIATAAPLQPGQNVRRSSRLFSNSYSVKENNKSPNRNKFVTPKSPSRKTKSRSSKTNLNKASFSDLNERNRSDKERSETITSSDSKLICNTSVQNVAQHALHLQKQSAEGLMSLLREIGSAYLHLSQFNCRKAIECLDNLPEQQHSTGWVLSMLGKAHFELTEYEKASEYFREVREKEPYRCQLMELYSTALWHLQKEVTLSALAQELVEQDRNCAAAWCATGNCFSLQKEHDNAIKFLQRAVQVDPSFVYAYTLLGHEYVTTEELDKAMSCFRSAIRIDARHYNAWCGLGTIFSKQERYQLAEMYFKKALSINSQSSVLLCHIGVVQHALQKTDMALETLNIAISKDPKSPLCKFHRASIYFAVGRYAEALKELEELKAIVPKESLVYYLTGKVSEDYPSEGSSVPALDSSSQEGAEFVTLRATDSDESL
uniref:Cell division cycle protein 27 homolog n=1 Tax=Timema monikensis TaxID=170555 RepID=A0A7R9HJF5_9NEOP|nr:unnamed protein product [Timema monikensis]